MKNPPEDLVAPPGMAYNAAVVHTIATGTNANDSASVIYIAGQTGDKLDVRVGARCRAELRS